MAFDLKREIRIYGRQTDLAKALGVSKAFVSNVYNGKTPPPDALLSEIGWERVKTTVYRRKKEKAE